MNCRKIIEILQENANPENVAGMARYGISSRGTLGVKVATLRGLARDVGRNHTLALELWASGIHEARILACLIDEPKRVTEDQLERWVLEIDSWDVCDQFCSKLAEKTSYGYQKARDWCSRQEEFVKRAGFVLIASLAVHDKKAPNSTFEAFLPLLQAGATDERNYVKKGVNWALRQIGKRNVQLHSAALETARHIQSLPSRSARWIASDALRELQSEKVLQRLTKLKS